MARRHLFWLLPVLLAGCPHPAASTTSVVCLTRCGSGGSLPGALREFTLAGTGQEAVSFPSSTHLALLLSASGSAPPGPVDFKIQAAPRVAETALSDSWRWQGPLSLRGGSGPARSVQDIPQALDLWINTGDSTAAGDCLRHVVQIYRSAHAYFYLDEGPGAGATGACAAAGLQPTQAVPAGTLPAPSFNQGMSMLAKAFEQGFTSSTDPLPGAAAIYPTVTGLFGPDPGGDSPPSGDPTFVVISPAVDDFGQQHGLMGYFWERDMQPVVNSPGDPRQHSNQRPVVFLSDQIFAEQPYTTYGTLAHEFTHLVVYYQRTKAGVGANETWWNEALAMLSMDRCGYGWKAGNQDMAKDLNSFLEQPAAYSLTDWDQDPHGFAYGLVSLFARYLFDRFGPAFIREVALAPDGGVAALDAALQERGTSFEAVYEDFMIAIYAASKGLALGGVWQLAPDLDVRGLYGSVQLAGVQTQLAPPGDGLRLPAWSTAFFDLSQGQSTPWNFSLTAPGPLFGSGIGF